MVALRVPLLSDTRGIVCQAYGVMEADQQPPERMTFVIDRQGYVRHIVPYVPDIDALLRYIQSPYL